MQLSLPLNATAEPKTTGEATTSVRAASPGAALHPARARRWHASRHAAAVGIETRGAGVCRTERAMDREAAPEGAREAEPTVHRDEPALRKRALTELPPALLALARSARHHRHAHLGAQSALALGRVLGARIDYAELAADSRARLRARLRHDSRIDASPRAQSFATVLAARRGGVPANSKTARRWLRTDGQQLFRGGETC